MIVLASTQDSQNKRTQKMNLQKVGHFYFAHQEAEISAEAEIGHIFVLKYIVKKIL